MSAYLFAAAMGFLWLGTVPLTNGGGRGIFGVKHLAMLSGFVFLLPPARQLFRRLARRLPFRPHRLLQLVWLIAIGLSVISVS